jgi:uncharacterized protein YraI
VPMLVLAFTAVGAPRPAAAASTWSVVVDTGGGALNVRSDAATDRPILRRAPNGATLTVVCQVYGVSVTGPVRTSAMWDRLSAGGVVSDAYVRWPGNRPSLPWCGEPPVNAGVASVSAPGGELNVRSGPGTGHSILTRLANGTGVSIACKVWGESINGNAVWNQIGTGRYVTDAYLRWSPSRPRYPWCGQAAPTVPAPNATAFLARVAAPARASAAATKVPASVTIAQAILESGWGRSWLTRLDHSYFGMKCFGGPGLVAAGCTSYATHECDGGSCYSTRAQFRAYRQPTDSFVDHGKQLAALSIYRTAMRYTSDPDRFAHEIHNAGYATSPTYANDLIALMRQFDLYKYDRAP